MTKRGQLTLIAGISAVVGLGLGFFAGVFSGVFMDELSNGAGQAVLIWSDLSKLRKGKTEEAVYYLEDRLDNAILAHGRFVEAGYYRWVLYPWQTEAEFRKYEGWMRKIAQYRKAYPRNTSRDYGSRMMDDPRLADLTAWRKSVEAERDKKVQQILAKYEK
jgi:hypothetical protein